MTNPKPECKAAPECYYFSWGSVEPLKTLNHKMLQYLNRKCAFVYYKSNIYILHDKIRPIFVFMFETLMWFHGPPTEVIAPGDRFTFEYEVGP